MMLRASVEMTGKKVDMNVVTGNDATVQESILFGDILVAFAEALVRNDDTLTYTRKMVIEQMGSETLIDAAALVGNFQQMVRIANSTGIPLDTPMAIISKDLQKKLGFNRFQTAENTPNIGFLQQAVGKVLRPIAMVILRIFGVIHNTMKSKD
jgi:hypothetical protein